MTQDARTTQVRRWQLVTLAALALLFGYIAGQSAPVSAAQEQAGTRWEYAELEFIQALPIQTFRLATPEGVWVVAGSAPIHDEVVSEFGLVDDGETPLSLLILNTLGLQGWEFVGMARLHETSNFVAQEYVFRRRVD